MARLISPGSELSTFKYIKNYSALNELIGNNISNMNINQLYKIADLLYKNKDEIEKHFIKQKKTYSYLKIQLPYLILPILILKETQNIQMLI
jgi:hypothetical protein